MHRGHGIWILVAALAASTAHGKTIEAIWRMQQVEFAYDSPSVSYSCSGLSERIRSILRAVDAHQSIVVDMGCNGDELVTSTRATISIAAPVEATDENIQAATNFKPHQILAARLRATALPSATDIERFPASWQRILRLRPRLTRGDCDLLDALRRQVLPRLRVRNATGFDCLVESSLIAPVLRVEALVRTQIALPE
jgi:hypothetical protein